MHWPAVNAELRKNAAFRRASKVKKHDVEFEKANIIGTLPSVEQSTAETLDIDMCLTSIIRE
jgi:hypothetical protein